MKWPAIAISIILMLSSSGFMPFVYASDEAADEIAGVDLKTYLDNLRREFIELSESSEKDKLPLWFEKVHVELSVICKKEGTAGIKFYVIEAGGKVNQVLTQQLSFDVYFVEKPGDRMMTWMPPYPRDNWAQGWTAQIPKGGGWVYIPPIER